MNETTRRYAAAIERPSPRPPLVLLVLLFVAFTVALLGLA